MPKTLALSITAAVLILGLTACGGSSKTTTTTTSTPAAASTPAATSTSAATSTPSTARSALTQSASPSGQLKFTKSSLSAKAGKVTIVFTNTSPLPHNLTIQQGSSGPVVGATPTFMGGAKTLTVTLKAGTYTFYCSVPGHRAAGMQGTLTVS